MRARDETPVFPPAEGQRIEWSALPLRIQSAIEERLGVPVVETTTHAGGFSPGLASRVRTADSRDHFVKAVSRSVNPESIRLHRREARVAAALPSHTPAPAFRWSFDDDEWVVLAFDFVPGANPPLPWRAPDLQRVLDALVELADALTPSPIALEPAGELHGTMLMRWRDLLTHPNDLARVPLAWQARLDELIALEARWPEAAAGDALVHLDVRADNIVIAGNRVVFVDWPWAAVGASWLDLVAFLPSVAMQGGPDPESVWRAMPWHRTVDADAVDTFVAALAGMFTRQSLLPAQPGLPTLRAFQGAQGRVARRWLAQRRGWTDAVDA